MRDCPPFGQWRLGRANRGSFGSAAIHDLSGAEAEPWQQVGYKPSYAQQQTRARRWKGSRLERDASLRREVLAGLSRGWSPEQVAGRLARERGRRVISCESIYRFI